MFLDKKYIYLAFIIGGTTCLMRVFSRKVQSFTGNFIPLLWPSLGQWKITPLFKILLDDPPQTSQRLYITSGIKCLGPLLQHQGASPLSCPTSSDSSPQLFSTHSFLISVLGTLHQWASHPQVQLCSAADEKFRTWNFLFVKPPSSYDHAFQQLALNRKDKHFSTIHD